MVRPDRYVCQSWHVAARVIIQPYLRKSRRNRIEEEEKNEENSSEDESEQFETVIGPHSEAPFFTAREDDDYSVTEHSPSILSEASETLQEDVSKGARVEDLSKTLMVDQAPKTRISRVCKNMSLDERSETLIIDKVSQTSLSQTLLPFPATEQFHSVAEDQEDLMLDQTSSITLADQRNNSTQLVTLKEDSMTLVSPSSTTVLANTSNVNPQLSHCEKEQELSECKIDCAKIRSGGEGVQFGEALRQVDKFLEETEQYLAGQGFKFPTENEKGNFKECDNDHPVNSPKQSIKGRRKPQKLVVPRSFSEREESSVTALVEASQVSSICQTLLPSEKSAGSKQERTYKSKWFDKIKNKFEKTEDGIPSKRIDTKNESNDITYDEIDEDSDGPYMPTSEVIEVKEEEEEEVFYKRPPPPRPLPKRVETEERDVNKIVAEHIYEEIAPRLATPVRYRRKRGQKVADPDAEKDHKVDRRDDVALKPAKKTTSCMTGLATCMPWWMAKRFYWKKDKKSEAKFKEEAKRNSRIRARQSYA